MKPKRRRRRSKRPPPPGRVARPQKPKKDYGPGIRRQRGEVVVRSGIAQLARQHPMLYYEARRHKCRLSMGQISAGMRLLEDYSIGFSHATVLGKLTDLMDTYFSKGMTAGMMNVEGARERYGKVMAALPKISRDIAEMVIIEGRHLNEIHAKMGWAKGNSGIDRFRETLNDIQLAYIKVKEKKKQKKLDNETVLDVGFER